MFANRLWPDMQCSQKMHHWNLISLWIGQWQRLEKFPWFFQKCLSFSVYDGKKMLTICAQRFLYKGNLAPDGTKRQTVQTTDQIQFFPWLFQVVFIFPDLCRIWQKHLNGKVCSNWKKNCRNHLKVWFAPEWEGIITQVLSFPEKVWLGLFAGSIIPSWLSVVLIVAHRQCTSK